METSDLVKIYSAANMVNAELIVGLFNDYGIQAHILNQRDTQFLFGDVEIYVDKKDVEAATTLLQNRNK
ncbi:MAG: DUF2007 domain-containing protein [Bacteroidales bacterium]|nr:DUF2007 domain-containing protein [Bacteroidales bacterium]